MNILSYKIGYWSSIFLTFTFIIWIISFIGIAATSSLFYWTNLNDYITYYQSNNHFFQNLAMFFMMICGPLYILVINSYYSYVSDNKKALVRASLLFGLGFAVLSSLHYFVQLSSVRLNLAKGNFDGIGHFVQANPNSVMTAIDMAGWTLFLGLSAFFIFPVFKGKRPNKILRFSFFFLGFSCLMAGIGYVFQIDILTFTFINLGVGGALMLISITSIRLFRKFIKEAT